jgi:hypothetical protein
MLDDETVTDITQREVVVAVGKSIFASDNKSLPNSSDANRKSIYFRDNEFGSNTTTENVPILLTQQKDTRNVGDDESIAEEKSGRDERETNATDEIKGTAKKSNWHSHH